MPCGCKKGHGMSFRGGGMRRKRKRRRGGAMYGASSSTWTPSYLLNRGGAFRRVRYVGKRGSGMRVSGGGMSISGAGLRGKRVLPRRGRGKRMI